MLRGAHLTFAHGTRPVLDDVSVTLATGEVIGLGGPSGSGKSTLGRILAGRLTPQSGRVELDGRPLSRSASGLPAPVQYAPQVAELAVDPRWRIGRILANGGKPDREACAALGIQPAWDTRYPSELSGGELARVSLARLFHPGLRALICDEITAQLDALEQVGLLDRLTALARHRQLGLILISHNGGLHGRYCDRSVELSAGNIAHDRRTDSAARRAGG